MVIEVLFDLAINERQAWAIKEVLDRALGKVVEARGQPEQSPLGAVAIIGFFQKTTIFLSRFGRKSCFVFRRAAAGRPRNENQYPTAD